jgi:hypothetical protein
MHFWPASLFLVILRNWKIKKNEPMRGIRHITRNGFLGDDWYGDIDFNAVDFEFQTALTGNS